MRSALRARWGAFPWLEVLVVIALAALTRSATVIVIAAAGLVAWALVEATGRLALVALDIDVAVDPVRLVAGERATLTVRVANRKPLPVPWMELRVELPEGIAPPRGGPGLPASSVSASFAPRGRERVTLRFPLEVTRRGAYVIGPLRVRAGDWLGFVQEERRMDVALHLIAHPAPVGVVDRHLASLRPVAESPARRGLVPDPLRFRGVREYRGGDPVKEIHWKASARLRSLQTKVYEAATSLDTIFLVNVASYEQYWVQADPEGGELVIAASAELIRLAAEAGRQVGLITNGLDDLTHQRPRSAISRGPRALARCLDILARLGPYAGAAPDTVFLKERGRIAAGATCVCVTPGLWPHLASALVVLRRSGHRVLVLTKDRPDAGVLARLRAADVSLSALDMAARSPWARPAAAAPGVRRAG
ncbi:MAG: DUF58 domain-containing protein [Chloroflexota bacterium]|nr:DUF58 domain-containing protein [Chloroflexota bacterium]